MADDQELYPCPLCPKRYKRREHMQRHWTSHSASKGYSCAQCGRGFQRLDVLKRHARTCEARARGFIPPVARRRACDLCVRQKKACSTGQPCDNCVRLAVACCYSFPTGPESAGEHTSQSSTLSAGSDPGESHAIQTTCAADDDAAPMDDFSSVMLGDPVGDGLIGPSDANPNWCDFLQLIQGGPFASDFTFLDGSQQGQPTGHQSGNRRYSFMFLENFTRRTGLLESFECGSPALREQTVSHFLGGQENGDGHPIPGMPDTLASDGMMTCTTPSTNIQNPWLHDPLMIKVHQIIVLAKEVVTLKPRNSVVTVDWSASLEQKCLAFFSPTNVRKFLALYWAIWHPNVNLVHRPTFDPATASPTLLAAMAVMGKDQAQTVILFRGGQM
ncbi:hypothetical protein IMZ48_03090 [Candidatus Bathyarchaeota archaeon]|nr:hypothetical protein [Candidatus Bathyarchaeota archaeon]